MTAAGLALMGCEEQVIEPPSLVLYDKPCIYCEGGWDPNPYLDSLSTAMAELHNSGLDSVKVVFEDSVALGGPLGESEAEAIAKPRVEAFLTDAGYPGLDWDGTWSGILGFQDPQSFVTEHADSGLSQSARDLIEDFWGIFDPSTPKTFQQASDEFEALQATAAAQLSGTEEEAFVAMAGAVSGSLEYWPEALTDFGDLVAPMDPTANNCGWDVLWGDAAGGALGFLVAYKVGAIRGALLGSTAAVIKSCR